MGFALAAVVLANAQVLTMNAAQPTATTVAILDGKIAYVGDDLAQARKAAGGKPEVIDLAGRTVMPGFNDAHVHFGLSITLGSEHGVDVQDSSAGVWRERVKRASAARPDDDWLFVKTRNLPEGIRRASDLEFVSRPLFVVTSHGGLFNKRGMAKGHFTEAEAPQGFVRGRELAAALDRLVKSLPLRTLTDGAHEFLEHLAKSGITSVQLIDELPDLFEGLRRKGQLTARVRMIPLGYRFETRMYEPTWSGPAPEWVRVDGVKYFHDDGARITRFELKEIFDRNVAAGRPIVVHVLSRRALDTLLDSVETLARESHHPEAARLYRIEHADEVTPEQAQRLQRLGMIVCSNPSMIPEWHTERAFPMRTLLTAGVRTCIGTDWVGAQLPPRPLEPLRTVSLAATHGGFGDKERITVAEALEAYTVGSATGEQEAAIKGSIATGKLADLIVLSDNPLKTAPDKLTNLQVQLTMVGGKIVFDHPGLVPPQRPPPPTIGPAPKQRPSTIGPPRSSP